MRSVKPLQAVVFLDRATFFFLCVLVFVLPATIAGVSIFFSLALLCFLLKKIFEGASFLQECKAWFGSASNSADKILLPVFLPLGIFILINLLSVFLSQYPQLSQKAFAAKVMRAVFFFFMMHETLTTEKRALTFLKVFLASAVVLSFDGLIQLWTGFDVFKKMPILEGRISASLRHPNDLGGYLTLILPLAFYFFFDAFAKSNQKASFVHRLMRRILLGGVFVLLFLNLGLTYSRGAWIGFLCGMIFFMIVCKRLWLFIFTAVAIFLLVFLPLLQNHRNVSFTSDNVSATKAAQHHLSASGEWLQSLWREYSFKDFSGTGRVGFWQDAVHIISDYPVMGTGLNTYTQVIKKYADVWKAYPHNCYLQMAAEIGLVGLGIFLWMLVAIFWNALRWIKNVTDEHSRGLWLAVLAGLFGFLVHSAFDTAFYSVQLSAMLWMIMGLLAAKWTIRHSESCKLTKEVA